jgi:hypothetical protein
MPTTITQALEAKINEQVERILWEVSNGACPAASVEAFLARTTFGVSSRRAVVDRVTAALAAK